MNNEDDATRDAEFESNSSDLSEEEESAVSHPIQIRDFVVPGVEKLSNLVKAFPNIPREQQKVCQSKTNSGMRGQKSSSPEPPRATPTRTTRSTPDTAKIFLTKTRAQLLKMSTSANKWETWTVKEVRGELVSKGYLEENKGATIVTTPALSILAMVALRIAASLPDNAAVAADALRALAVGIELKKSELILEGVARDVRELLSLARDAKEKEEVAEGVAEDMRSAALQLTHMVEEQAVDIEVIATRLEDDLKRVAERAGSAQQAAEQGPPTGPRSYAAMAGKGTLTAEQAGILAREAAGRTREGGTRADGTRAC
ncbi:hypothetical protein B0H19DRAFT_1231016 [Mycena capillaripes]|nr:hypothetical protein B0H19DRAFT_1231016 [Mycena capillaripes]